MSGSCDFATSTIAPCITQVMKRPGGNSNAPIQSLKLRGCGTNHWPPRSTQNYTTRCATNRVPAKLIDSLIAIMWSMARNSRSSFELPGEPAHVLHGAQEALDAVKCRAPDNSVATSVLRPRQLLDDLSPPSLASFRSQSMAVRTITPRSS